MKPNRGAEVKKKKKNIKYGISPALTTITTIKMRRKLKEILTKKQSTEGEHNERTIR